MEYIITTKVHNPVQGVSKHIKLITIAKATELKKEAKGSGEEKLHSETHMHGKRFSQDDNQNQN